MNKFINKVYRSDCGKVIGVEYDDSLYAPVMESLNRNNTFCPNIRKVLFRDKLTTCDVWFSDGSYVTVHKCKDDPLSTDAAIAFAIMKRLYGKVNDDGSVTGANLGNHLKTIIDSAYVKDKTMHKCPKKTDKKVDNTKKESLIKKISNKVKKSHKPLRDEYGRFRTK